MTWQNQWSYKVDGTEINDHVNYVCQIPELSHDPEVNVIMAEIAGDYPVVVRSQPQPSKWTFNIAMFNSSPAQFDTKITSLKAIFAKGVRHTLVVQARGMANPKQVYFWVEGTMVDYTTRLLSVRCTVPKPVLTAVP